MENWHLPKQEMRLSSWMAIISSGLTSLLTIALLVLSILIIIKQKIDLVLFIIWLILFMIALMIALFTLFFSYLVYQFRVLDLVATSATILVFSLINFCFFVSLSLLFWESNNSINMILSVAAIILGFITLIAAVLMLLKAKKLKKQ